MSQNLSSTAVVIDTLRVKKVKTASYPVDFPRVTGVGSLDSSDAATIDAIITVQTYCIHT